MSQTARLFRTGGSQAVRLPADCRFPGEVVYVRRDAETGDVILSTRPLAAWDSFMALRAELGPVVPADFLSPAERAQGTEARDALAGWAE